MYFLLDFFKNLKLLKGITVNNWKQTKKTNRIRQQRLSEQTPSLSRLCLNSASYELSPLHEL